VIDDERSEFDNVEAAESWLRGLIEAPGSGIRVARVQNGGLLAAKIMDELPPTRHRLMGRPRE